MTTRHAPVPQTTDLLADVEALLDAGQCLQAYQYFDVLKLRRDPEAQLVLARLMRNLGADRPGDALSIRVWRSHRDHPGARVAMFRHQVYRTGPYRGWKWRSRLQLPDDAPDAERAEFFGLESFLFATLRDFEAADASFARAMSIAPNNAWLWAERAYTLQMADRYEEAMAAADHALALSPGYRSALQPKALLLALRGEADAAIALLRDAFASKTCGDLGAHLFMLLEEHGRDEEAAAVLDRIEALRPLADKFNRRWLAARRADIALLRSDWAVAARECRAAEGEFYPPIAERIAAADGRPMQRRVKLPVSFVRQHWMTCAPATLTALARYWGREADHLEVAEAICYDGTSHLAERQWAQDNDFVAREFTLDWDSARALIDAGIPFTLTTTFTSSGHLQAVIGYDLLRNSLLIRDPFQPTHAEFEVVSLIDVQRAYGPRAMAMVPSAKATLLDGIALPDVDLWDLYYRMAAALARHDRDAALAEATTLSARASGHRLAINAQRMLAYYDADEPRGLEQTEALLALYPTDSNLQLAKAVTLWNLGEHTQQFEWLESLARSAGPDAHVLTRYAERLSEDGRRVPAAHREMERAFRRAPADAALWLQKGMLVWADGTPRDALPYYRFAATLQDTNEHNASSYMRACHIAGASAQGLAFLQARVARLGSKSSQPARTLFEHLDALERVDEAFSVLDAALAAHPGDTDLLLFCAEARLRYGQIHTAQAIVDRIGTSVRRAAVLRVRALVANADTRLDEALRYAEEAAALEPLDLRLHRLVASLRARLQGNESALDWLRRACARFPRNPGLSRLHYEWIDAADPAASEAVLRDMAAHHPDDVWVLRELANHLTRQRRFDEARPFAADALVRAPTQSSSHATMAFLALRAEGYAAAEPHLRAAIRCNIDDGFAVDTFVDGAPTLESRRAALEFVWDELLRQVTLGDGLLNYRGAAQRTLEPEALLESLRYALKVRPDLWHAWVAVAAQLSDMGRSAEALAILGDAAGRFTRLPRLHYEHARAYMLQGERERALASLESALVIAPAWGPVVREYVDRVVESGRDLERAERVLRHALTRGDENPDLRALLGWLLERIGRPEEAVEAVVASLRSDPAPTWVWETARRLFHANGRKGDFSGLIEEVLQARPGDPTVWAVKAELATDADAALAAAEHGLGIDPRHLRNWIARCAALLRLKRFDEIDTLLAATPWGDAAPLDLRVFGARTLRARGKTKPAREAMRALLAQDGNRYPLWRELADWADEDDRHDEYAECSEHLLRLAPNYAQAHGYRGHARMKQGDPQGAMVDFHRALELDPSYGFAAVHLATLGLDHDALEQARFAVDVHGPHSASARIDALRTRIAVHGRDKLRALDAARDTLRHRADAAQFGGQAVRALAEAGWDAELNSLITERIQAGDCPASAVDAWLESRVGKQPIDALYGKLRPLIENDPAHALLRGLVNFAGRRSQHFLFDQLLRDHKARLQSDGECWGLVGWAHIQFDRYRAAAKWYADWAERSQRPTWALENLALAHMAQQEVAPAINVARVLLAEEPGNCAAHLWMAAAAALRGEHSAVERSLANAGEVPQRHYMHPVADLLHAWAVAVAKRAPACAEAAFLRAGKRGNATPGLRMLRSQLGGQLLRLLPWWKRPYYLYVLLLA